MKKWGYWSIDCADDYELITISGDSNTPYNVCVVFSSGVAYGDYTVTYNDGIRCISSGYTVHQPSCPSSGDVINTYATIPASPTQTTVPIGDALLNAVYTAYTFSSDTTSMIDNIRLGGDTAPDRKYIIGDVTQNTGGSPRTATITATINGPDLPSEGCECTFTVTQEGAGCNIIWFTGETCVTCSCSKNDFQLNYTSLSISSDGYNNIIGNVSDCIDKENMYITAVTGNLWDGVILEEHDTNDIYLVVPRNDSAAREITAQIGYSATCGTDIWTKELTLSQDGTTPISCECSDLTFEGVESDCPVMVSLYNDYGNVIYLEDIGLKVDGAWKYQQVDQDDGEIDYQKERVVAVLDYSTSDFNKTIQNASATIGQDSVNPGVKYCQMACSPTTISPGAVIRLTWDGDWSGSHHSCEDPGDGKIKVSVDVNPGTTSPAVHFLNSSNTQLLGVTRYTTDTETTGTWKATSGTCTKLQFVEMGGNYTRLTITIQKTGQAPITLLQNGIIPSTSGSYLSLDRSFKIEDYYDSSTCTIYLTFR